MFLSMETERAWGHVSGLSILDTSEAPDFSFEKLLKLTEERVKLVPRFTWRLQEVPLSLDRPYWVECPEFDIRNHVTRIAVRSPGSLRELSELVGRLNAGPLKRDRPLWQMWFIEGVEGGKTGMFMKSHHCLMDGAASAGLSEVLCDLTPDAEGPPVVPDSINEPTPRPPARGEIAWNSFRNVFVRSAKRTEHIAHAVRDAWQTRDRANDEFAPPAMADVPKLSFNGAIGDRRGFSCASLELEDLKKVKKHFGVTLNDVVLEIVGGALRGWLLDRGELPEQPIVALCPVSLREAGDQSLDNQVTNMSVSLATDLPDPEDRVRRIHLNAVRAKEWVQEASFDMIAASAESLAPVLVNLLMRVTANAPEGIPLPGNLVVSNVRGAPVPLYTAGARIESIYPMSVLQPGQGLNLTVVSYMGTMGFGFTVDPDLVPDAWELAERIPRAFKDLEAAAEVERRRRE
jgi:WS/DGAT/MGAT family acyltransferase